MKVLSLFFAIQYLLSAPANGQVKHTASAITNNTEARSIETIRRLFNSYIRYEAKETTESAENKEAMKAAITSLPATVNKKDLPLIIEVWMYYDPTDFTTRNMIMPIFLRNKQSSVAAIKYRIVHRKTWETADGAPYSELNGLVEDLKLNK